MKMRPLVMFCWAQVIVATAMVCLNFYSLTTRPALGLEYGRPSGRVVHVTEDGPAEAAGIRVGDRVVSVNGHGTGVNVIPLFYVPAGKSVPVGFERDGVRQTVAVTTITNDELRRRSLMAGGARTVSAVSNYLAYPLHVWMMLLAVVLLVLRPGHRDARLAALLMVYWAGTLFAYRLPGAAAVFAMIPESLHVPFVVVDAIFSGFFFALCGHFALVFARERESSRRWWWVELLPYAATLPIVYETYAHGMQRLRGDVNPPDLPWTDAMSTIGALLLFGSLAVLFLRFRRMTDANARRRVQLIFLSFLPGSTAFIFSYIVDVANLGFGWQQSARLVQSPATALGSFLFVYAVVRHRMFNIRVLVRRSLRYALARSTLLVLMSLPVIGLALFLYAHRRESLADLLTGTPAVYLLVILPLVAMIRYRKTLLESLDRRFFREQYDARRLLLHVISIVRGGSDMLAISRASLDEIDKALHPKHISLWPLDPEGAQLHRGFYRGELPPEAPPLDANGMLATLLANDEEALDVHGRQTRALLQRLGDDDREWLRAADAYLIVPLLIEKRLVGAMVLGERMSEEPFSREDRELLRMLGGQLALTLDYARLKHSPSLVWAPPSDGRLGGGTPTPMNLSDIVQLCPRCGRCYARDAAQCELDQQTLVPETGVPRTIEDKYVITKLLGRGGMGSVYQATQKRLNRPVAIKVLLAHLVGSSSMRTRFEREARIVARLRHPAIVTIHDFGVLPSGHAYLVMEYLDGDTLRKTINSGPQPLGAALSILAPVGEAVDAAHKAGVVHRDLKPENIMLVKDHSVLAPRVLDFGLAKMHGPIGEDEATLVQSQSIGVVGTLMYMAPEVLSGRSADAKSDQYSLALIAYELIAGEHPLGHATDLASVVRGHTDQPLRPISDLVKDVPRHVSDAIQRALAKKAEERFDSVADFMETLRRGSA
jgi:eukaryotic-like serine/threonine-protein kinase